MTITPLASIPAAAFLSVEEQRRLIADAQDVPVTISTDAEGEERIVYGKTPASEAALERLTESFISALHKAARASKVIDREDAFGIVMAEFVAAVRRHDTTSDVPFSATIGTILMRAISDADRTSDLIVVRENVAARYWRLMHKHEGSVEAAYAECRDTANNFDPATFLAVHRAIGGVDSLDRTAHEGSESTFVGGPSSGDPARLEAALAERSPGPEEIAVQADLVAWLWTLVNDRQEGVLRLRFGFRDLATENLRVAAGYREGEDLSDVQVAHALSIPRPTVQRLKKTGLEVMRAALQDLVNEAEEA